MEVQMKKALVILIVLATCLIVVPAAFAHARCNWKDAASANHFRIKGTVSGVDGELGTLSVKVRCAGRGMRHLRGREITVNVSAETEIYLCQEGVKTSIGLIDLKAGDRVKVRGTVGLSDQGERVYTASKVMARHVVPHFRVKGTVVGAFTELGTLTVTVQCAGRDTPDLRGQEITVNVTADTKIFRCQEGAMTAAVLGNIKRGDRVWVCGTIVPDDPNASPYTAKLILDRPPLTPSATL
jgi:hypothetical protein